MSVSKGLDTGCDGVEGKLRSAKKVMPDRERLQLSRRDGDHQRTI